jgi:hypothetical protein
MRCMADRYLTENREAAIGVQQMFHMRQRWGSAVWRAQTQVLLRRLKCALPAAGVGGGRVAPGGSGHGGHDGGGQLLYSCRSHASGSDGGGGLGGDSRWGAGYGGDVVRVDRRQSGCLELVLCGGEWRIRSAWPGPPAWGKPVCVCFFLGGGAALLGLKREPARPKNEALSSWRSHASGSGDGGGLGGDSSWGAGCGGDVGRVGRQ